MSEKPEEIREEEINNEDTIHRIRLKRHLWPDEEELLSLQNKIKNLRVIMIVLCACALVLGWLLGSVLPAPSLSYMRQGISTVKKMDSNKKIESVMDIMETDWYFGKDIEGLDERLETQALKAITNNEEDPHTDYLSKEEIDSFVQSINRNFTGIGVEFISNDGINIVQKVFKNSPAEKAGVLAGDIINKVDGVSMEGSDAEQVKAVVQGDEGTSVTIEFLRDGKPVTLDIVRGKISATTFAKIMDSNIGYLELYQFGDGTPEEAKAYLDEFRDKGIHKLIIDLRDNGGGYLDVLCKIAGYFVPEKSVVVKQEYRDGTIVDSKSTASPYENYDEIVILVNENTASASEIFTLTMKELRDDVTVVGKKTYGKGTVQITCTFDDGSALKYTTSRWLSPSGVSINGTGIEPDEEVNLHEVLTMPYTDMEEGDSYTVDSVSEYVRTAQLAMDYLGYASDRKDGYFSAATEQALKNFQQDKGLEVTGVLDEGTYKTLISNVVLEHSTNEAHDPQLQRAKELLND